MMVAASLTGIPLGAIAKAEHKTSWLGAIHQRAGKVYGEKNPLRLILFDRDDQTSFLKILQDFGDKTKTEKCSLLVHVDGTRSSVVSDEPVKTCSSVLTDLAIRNDFRIVPVRFARGLPRENNTNKIDFPWDLGRQDYYFGEPIQPEDLKGLNLVERQAVIVRRINETGPDPASETPDQGDPNFLAMLEEIRTAQFVPPEFAILVAALELLENRSPVSNEFLKDIKSGGDLWSYFN